MQKLKFFTHCALLAATPSLLSYPEQPLPQPTPQTVNCLEDWWWGTQEQTTEWVRPTTYDGIIQMLEDLESGVLERKYSAEQLEHVNEYLTILAKEGVLPDEFDEEIDLEEDTYHLMYGENSAFELTRYLENSNKYMVIPAVLNGYLSYNIIQCGKISKSWKKTKKFVKKHKKKIIIVRHEVAQILVVAMQQPQILLCDSTRRCA